MKKISDFKTALRLVCLSLALSLLFPGAALAASGSDYTDDAELARQLDEIFTGEARLFTNTDNGYPLDSYIGGGTFVVDGRLAGSECYIYANAVYFYLFGELPEHGNGPYIGSRVALRGCREASYEAFAEAGVSVGTYLRTTDKKDGSYNSSAGHSLIVLAYDEEGMTWLDANWGTQRYYVHLNTHDWEYVGRYLLKNGRRISHAVIPYRTSVQRAVYDGRGGIYDFGELGVESVLVIPATIDSIGEEAFDRAQAILLTESVTAFGSRALGNAIIFAPEGSAAQAYASENGLEYHPIYDGWSVNQ